MKNPERKREVFIEQKAPIVGREGALRSLQEVSWSGKPFSRDREATYLRWNVRAAAFGEFLRGHKNFGLTDWEEYEFSYVNASQILIEEIRKEVGQWEQVILPLCMLHRHYIELSFKFILFSANESDRLAFQLDCEDFFGRAQHNLERLWQQVKVVFKEILCPDDLIATFEKSLMDYLAFEESVEATRYPVAKDLRTATTRFSHRFMPTSAACDLIESDFSFLELAEVMLLKTIHNV